MRSRRYRCVDGSDDTNRSRWINSGNLSLVDVGISRRCCFRLTGRSEVASVCKNNRLLHWIGLLEFDRFTLNLIVSVESIRISV